jgi:23S rRNA (pseudouridine1915-N3)-methyltransferase
MQRTEGVHGRKGVHLFAHVRKGRKCLSRDVTLLLLVFGCLLPTCVATSRNAAFRGASSSAFVQPLLSTPPLLLRGGGRVHSATAPSAFKFHVITISQTKEKWCEAACAEYASRIKKFGVGFEETTLKPAIGPPKQTEEQQKEEEGKILLNQVDVGKDRLVLLDERGDLLTSHEFADYIQRCADSGDRSITFAIGGASGHSESVRATAKKAGRMLSLGKMVMNHQIARVVLLEQIYRALTIQRGIPYHK